MRLTDHEEAIHAGRFGEPRRRALELQIRVGRFFDAEDFVEIDQVHLMADTESLGESGVAYLEELAACPEEERRVLVPTVTDPRGVDFEAYERLGQQESWVGLERRAIDAFTAMGLLMTDTCINYHTIMPPAFGQHVAFGDTGSTIYANSVLGARSNFEGGPSALAAALTGRTPRYGCHLGRRRLGSHRFVVADRPRTLSDWGALGGVVGRATGSYWTVPVLEGIDGTPTPDELKHFGAALASFGSVPLFHIVGVTPEAHDLGDVFDGAMPDPKTIARDDLDRFYDGYGAHGDGVDVVVFAAPQQSLVEMQQIARLLKGRRVHKNTALIAATSPEIKAACDRMGITAAIEEAGGLVLKGVCFYQMYAREIGEANGWRRLLSNSAKLVNIIGGYGYEPVLASTERCIDAAVAGRMAK